MKRTFILFLIFTILPFCGLHAQRQIMVFDPELGQPVKGFTVWTNKSPADSTNIFGEVAVPEKFDTLLLTKPGYIALRIPASLVEDSIPVIKDYNSVGEVVVYASRQSDFQDAVRRWTRGDRTEVELRNPITGIGFNLSDLLNKKKRRDKRNAKRMAKLFDRMDAEDNDPIIHSYRRALNIESKH